MKGNRKQRIKSRLALLLSLLLAFSFPGHTIPAWGAGMTGNEVDTETSFTITIDDAEITAVQVGGDTLTESDGSYTITAGTLKEADVTITFQTEMKKWCEETGVTYEGLSVSGVAPDETAKRKFTYSTTVEDVLDSDSGAGSAITLSLTDATTYTITQDEKVTVALTPSYWADGSNGYYAPQKEGESVTVTLNPDKGYELTNLTLSGESQTAGTSSIVIDKDNAGNIAFTVQLIPMNAPTGTFQFVDTYYGTTDPATVTYTLPDGENPNAYDLQYLIKNGEDSPQAADVWTDWLSSSTAGGVTTYQCQVDYTSSVGSKKVYVRYKDTIVTDHYSDYQDSSPIRFDFTAPAVTGGPELLINEQPQSGITGYVKQGDTVSFRLTVSDSESGLDKLTYTIDGTSTDLPANGAKEVTFTIPYAIAEKTDSITYTVTDCAGNTTSEQTIDTSKIEFDFTLPTATITFKDAQGNVITDLDKWYSEEVYVEIAMQDPDGSDPSESVSGIDTGNTKLLNNGETISYTEQAGTALGEYIWSSGPLPTGRHMITLEVADKAGNTSSYSSSAAMKIDMEGIQETGVVFENGDGKTDFYEAFAITAEASSYSGITKMEFTFFDESGKQTGTPLTVSEVSNNLASILFPADTLGNFKGSVQITYTDNCGRRQEGFRYPFSYNREGAAIRMEAKEEWSNGDQQVSIEVSDGITGIETLEIYVDGRLIETRPVNDADYKGEFLVSENSASALGTQIQVVAVSHSGKRVTSYAVVRIDKQAPAIQLSGMTEGGIYNGIRTLQITTSENIWNEMQPVSVTVERTLDGATTTLDFGSFGMTADVQEEFRRFTEDGSYLVTVTAVDAAGNTDTKRISFIIDRTAPQLSMTGVREGDYSNAAVTVNFQAVESFFETNEVVIEVLRRLDGSTYESTVNFMNSGRISNASRTFTEDGDYTITMRATDRAGNVGAVQTVSFTVDRTAPTVSLSGTKDYFVTGEPVTLNFSVIEAYFQTNRIQITGNRKLANGQTVALRFPAWNNSGRTSLLSQSFSEDGYYTIVLSAVDKAGNASEQTLHFTIDTQAPVIKGLDKYDGKYVTAFRLEETLEDLISELTIPTVRLTLNGEAYNGEEITKEGKYTLAIEVTDEVGLRTVKTIEFVVDTTPPRVIFAGVENRKVYTEVVNLNLTLENEEDEITEILINGEPYTLTEGSSSYDLTFNSYGKYEVTVTTIDRAGNEGSQSITFTYSEYRNNLFLWILIAALLAAAALTVVIVVRTKKK